MQAGKLDVREILKELEESVSDIFVSERYVEYLQTFAKFHNYSFNNVIWILMQRPDATKVASFVDWNRKFNRHVKKGSKGIKILVPTPKKVKVEQEVKQADGTCVMEELEIKKMYFKVGNVFDIADTDGEELPCLVKKLVYDSDFLKDLIEKIVSSSKIPILITNPDEVAFGSSNGYYSLVKKEINVRADLSDLHMLKTILHELSHGIQETEYATVVKELDRASKEVVAESTAFTVMKMLSNMYGVQEMDSSEYSFGYVAGWSSSKETKELKATLSLIAEISNALYGWISNIEI